MWMNTHASQAANPLKLEPLGSRDGGTATDDRHRAVVGVAERRTGGAAQSLLDSAGDVARPVASRPVRGREAARRLDA